MDSQNTLPGNIFNASTHEQNISVDCVIFSIVENSLRVLINDGITESGWMLPGGFVAKNEEVDEAARRILTERTGAENVFLQEFKVFSNPNRFSFTELYKSFGSHAQEEFGNKLPERVISIGYFALVNYECIDITGGIYDENSEWINIDSLPDLIYDHKEIISEAIIALRKEMYFRPIGYNLLPEKFTMPELQKLYEIILDKKIERSSFQRKMLKWDIYERLKERREGVAHKRPFLYKFNVEKYERAVAQGISFGI